jgi:hypothetical protein
VAKSVSLDDDRRGRRIGTGAAVVMAVAATAALALGVATPPRGGPFCASGCLLYPYDGAAAYVPRDFLWMWPAVVMVLALVVLAAALAALAARDRRADGLVGLALVTVAAVPLLSAYAVQLAVVQPSLLAGEGADVASLSQYNPHGLFIALEDLGYLVVALAFVPLAGAIGPGRGVRRAARTVLIVGATLAVVAFVATTATYGVGLEYRFEVAAIVIDWLVLIVLGVLVADMLRRSAPSTASPASSASLPQRSSPGTGNDH